MDNPRSPVRVLVAVLCIVLTNLFAGASAASVIDRVEHQTRILHVHTYGFHFGFVAYNDHHPDRLGHTEGLPGLGGAHDHPAKGHHHTDAPAAAVGVTVLSSGVVGAVVTPLAISSDVASSGLVLGGLERPPRRIEPRI